MTRKRKKRTNDIMDKWDGVGDAFFTFVEKAEKAGIPTSEIPEIVTNVIASSMFQKMREDRVKMEGDNDS